MKSLNNFQKLGRALSIASIIVMCTMGASKCKIGKPKITLPNIHLKFGDPVELTIDIKGEIFAGIQIPIPDLGGAFVELIPNNPATGTSAQILISVPADQFENENFRLRDPSLLPDGRPLPRVNGKMPSVAINVPEWYNVTFYLGLEVAAIFVPTTTIWDPDLQITLPFSDSSGRQVGFISRIPAINGQGGGFFASYSWELAITIPDGHATIHKRDLRHGYINGKKYDLSEVFELP